MRICSSCHRCFDDHVEYCTENSHSALSESRRGSCEMIAAYRLEFLLESSVSGDLYRARQLECGQPCRIRILSASKKKGQQFLREAKHAAALFHPNLVDVYEAGTVDGRLYVVAEDHDGQTLREYLNNVGVPPLLNTIDIVEQTAEALHAFHLEGLLHRAVRPDNFVLTASQTGRLIVRLKDLDFGGAIERSIISNKFLIDTALDAVRYFAPEQCTGIKTGVQTDVYSLGIVLYEMLAGAPPFDAPKASGLIEMHRHQQPHEIRIDNFDLRMLLTHTLGESLQKSPERRHSSALAFARQLRHMEQLATHISTPPPAMTVPSVRAASVGAPNSSAARTHYSAAEAVHTAMVSANAVGYVEPPITNIESDLYDPWMQAVSPQIVEFQSEPAADEFIAPPTHVRTASEQHAPKEIADRISHLARIRRRKNRLNHYGLLNPTELHSPEVKRSEITEEPKTIEQVVSIAQPERVQLDADEITAVTARRGAAVVEWEQPEDDIPSVEAVIEVLSAEQITPAFDLDSPDKPTGQPVVLGERPSAPDSSEIEFFPGVMRESRGTRSIDHYPNYSILSAYGPTPAARISFDYQTLLLGGGIAALVAAFFAGNLMFRGIVQDSVSQAPALIGTESIQTDQPQATQPSVAKAIEKTVVKQKPGEVVTNTGNASSIERSQVPAGISNQKQPVKAPQVQTAEKTSGITSTLVISTQNGKVRSTIETAKRPNEQKPPIATNKPNMMGRPRIVGNPSQ